MPTDLLLKIQPFAIALALGLLIGIERERSHPPGYQPLGLRTFVLFSLLGALAARIDILIALSLTIFVGGVVIAGYIRSSRKSGKQPDLGFTTEVAAVVTYGLGYLAYSEPLVTLIIGVIVLVVLLARARLHKFSRNQLTPKEMQATATILVLAIGIIPFLPNKTVDFWNLFNPQRFGVLVLIIAILQFSAYIGIRLFGATRGILLSGYLAGFVSSTAATATLAHQTKKRLAHPWIASSAVILATVAMFTQLMIVISIAAPKLIYTVALPLLTTILIMGLVALSIGKYKNTKDSYPIPENPLSWKAAIRLAAILFTMLIIVTLAQRMLGPAGANIVVFLGGLVEIHGVTLALATLYHEGKITSLQAMNSLGIALMASFITKYIIAWTVVRGRFAVTLSLLMAAMICIFVVMWWFVVNSPLF